MVSETLIHNVVAACQGSGKTFAEFLVELFKDKFIEVYVGDAYEDVSTEQISTTYPAVFCGKLVAAYRECLILNCAYAASNMGGHIELGNIVFVNERAIRALNEIDGKGTMEDMMLRSKESLAIKDIFDKKKK
jgi:hypothetical protein